METKDDQRSKQQTGQHVEQETGVKRRVKTAPKERRRGDHDLGPPPASRTMTSSGYRANHFKFAKTKHSYLTKNFNFLHKIYIYIYIGEKKKPATMTPTLF